MKKQSWAKVGVFVLSNLIAVQVFSTMAQAAPIPVVPRAPLPSSSVTVTSFKLAKVCNEPVDCVHTIAYLELYNKASGAVSLVGWAAKMYFVIDGRTESLTVPLDETMIIRPKAHVLLASTSTSDVLTARPDGELPHSGVASELKIVALTVVKPDIEETIIQRDAIGTNQYTLNSAGDGYSEQRSAPKTLRSGGVYPLYESTPLQIREVFTNPTQCTPSGPNCADYVKVCNLSDEMINFFDYRIGYSSSSLKYISLDELIEARNCRSVEYDLSASGGNLWIEDAEGFIAYTSTVVNYPDISASRYDGYSWAYSEAKSAWQWGVPSPLMTENTLVSEPPIQQIINTLTPCRDGQYRSEESGRCRNILQAADTRKLCKDGQYRSEETGRCRSLVSAVTASLKPCGEDQFRNPSSGRCKKYASLDDLPKPCKEGYERNAETNRCRKIKASAMPGANFPVEPTAKAAESTAVWWVLGGVGALALGYVGWEWRREIGKSIQRLRETFISKK